jgi:hypothetical protein
LFALDAAQRSVSHSRENDIGFRHSETEMSNEHAARGAKSEFEWKGAEALKRVHALNERCLEVFAQLAHTTRERVTVEIVNRHRPLWRGLDAAARKRAAQTPYLLLDVHFQSEDWWHWAKNPRRGQRRSVVSHSSFPPKAADELMRETLMLAWGVVAIDCGAASLLLGMAPGVCAMLAELGPQDVERIAARHSRHLRSRWEDLPLFWSNLLHAARAGDEDSLYELHLHGVQLLGSELIPLLDKTSAA